MMCGSTIATHASHSALEPSHINLLFVLPVTDSFIMHYVFGDMIELEEAMRRAFHDSFKKDIKVSEESGIIMASSFDDRDS